MMRLFRRKSKKKCKQAPNNLSTTSFSNPHQDSESNFTTEAVPSSAFQRLSRGSKFFRSIRKRLGFPKSSHEEETKKKSSHKGSSHFLDTPLLKDQQPSLDSLDLPDKMPITKHSTYSAGTANNRKPQPPPQINILTSSPLKRTSAIQHGTTTAATILVTDLDNVNCNEDNQNESDTTTDRRHSYEPNNKPKESLGTTEAVARRSSANEPPSSSNRTNKSLYSTRINGTTTSNNKESATRILPATSSGTARPTTGAANRGRNVSVGATRPKVSSLEIERSLV